MPLVESKPVATSIRVDHEHTLEMRADMASKTAEVENVTTGEMYTGGGGDNDLSTAQVTFTGSTQSANMIAASLINEQGFIGSLGGVGAGVDVPATTLILYKGGAFVNITPENGYTIGSINATGNVESVDVGRYFVTGDCNFEILSE